MPRKIWSAAASLARAVSNAMLPIAACTVTYESHNSDLTRPGGSVNYWVRRERTQ
jgi:hypothetical protein